MGVGGGGHLEKYLEAKLSSVTSESESLTPGLASGTNIFAGKGNSASVCQTSEPTTKVTFILAIKRKLRHHWLQQGHIQHTAVCTLLKPIPRSHIIQCHLSQEFKVIIIQQLRAQM